MARIVIGVDGSETSQAALRWALQEARLRGAELDVVCAWSIPPMANVGAFVATLPVDSFAEAAKTTLDQALEACDVGGLTVRRHVDEGPAATRLLAHAGDAALLVVGSRGLGGFRELLLGSVSQHVAHYSLCPVVIVRHDPAQVG